MLKTKRSYLKSKREPTEADLIKRNFMPSDPKENHMFGERVKLERKVDICVRCFKF